MPLPENKPNAALLAALAEGKKYCDEINSLSPDIEPRVREWLTRSFPNCKIFENRVHSLTQLISRIAWEKLHGVKP